MKQKPHVFWKSVITLLGVAALGLYFYINAVKPKQKMLTATGAIVMLSSDYVIAPNDEGKSRFLKLADNGEVFSVFTGHESGDFSPEMEKVDRLKPGDVVSIYYTKTIIMSSDKINRGVQFIDKAGKPFFIKGNTDKFWGLGILAACLVLIGGLVILKLRGLIG